MKFNKWTLGLAAIGAVSLASVASADEAAKASSVMTSAVFHDAERVCGYLGTMEF